MMVASTVMAGKNADVDGLKVIKAYERVFVFSLPKSKKSGSQEIPCSPALWKLQVFNMSQPGRAHTQASAEESLHRITLAL